MDYTAQIRNFIVQNFLYGDAASLVDQTSFLEAGIIDSTGLLELVDFLEEEYNLHINDDELIPENLDTIANVASFLKRKLDAIHSDH